MKPTSDLAKALEVILKSVNENGSENMRNRYATQPIVVYGEEAAPEGELHLRDYWRTIRKRLWLIAGLAVIVSAIAAIRQADQPDIYQARSRVQVDTETYSPALGASKGSSFYVDNAYMDPEYFNTQVQIVTSPTLLRRVAKTLDLEHNRTFLEPRVENRSTWQGVLRMVGFRQQVKEPVKPANRILKEGSTRIPSSGFSAEDPGEIERLAPYVDTLAGMLDVSQVKKTRLIDIRGSHTDPAVATKVVNTTADAFALWNLEMKTKTNTVAGAYMQKRIAELQSQIRNGEEQLVNYAQSHEILSLDASQNTVVERLTGLNKELLVAENERNLAEAAYRTTRMMPGAAEANAEVSDKQIADFKTKLADLKQKRSQLLLTDTEESPEVRDVAQQIGVIEQQLEETRGSAKSILTVNLESNYRMALARETSLRESFTRQRAETVAQNQAAINYNILKQEIETNKGLLEGLMQRSKENDVSMAGTPNNIHVVDYSAIPPGPIGPRRTQAIIFASILALAFGVGLALFLEYLDDTIKTPNDIESGLRLPALAVIPIAGKLAKRLSPITTLLHRGGGESRGPELLIANDGPSQQAEAYKHLRTSLLLSTPGRAPKTILVTSSVPAEGKTTTVVNTATVLAQTGAKVLVIDADMRRPRLHHVFGLSNTAGLSAILSSEITEAETLAKINQYRDTNIYLLSSGAIPPNPAELLGSNQMKGLLDLAGDMFQYIVIDSPPIASFTDGVLISSLVDGVLLVVHGGKTSRQVVKRTRQILQEIGAKIIGVVLNKVEVRSGDYYYYHYDYKPNYPKAISNGHASHADVSASMLADRRSAGPGQSSLGAS